MANPKHLEVLKQGVEVWNEWRSNNVQLVPDLSHADLSRWYLSGVNFVAVNLSGAKLSEADLSWGYLSESNFKYADLSKANLMKAYLAESNLTKANLERADLTKANFSFADLQDAVLKRAYFNVSIFNLTGLYGADFSGAEIGWSTFDNVNLSGVRGLDKVRHVGPSTIGVDTIYNSAGRIPESFMRGCGLPETFIAYARSLVTQAIDFYSCFISYSSRDQEFAERLHADLQAKGVRVWFAPHDMKIGARIRSAIDESIRQHDKLLLVLSEASVGSQWVEQEVETALAREHEQEGKSILFPIRIDDAVMGSKAGWPALLKNTRNVGDFTRWKEHDSYQKAFERLLRDLKAIT